MQKLLIVLFFTFFFNTALKAQWVSFSAFDLNAGYNMGQKFNGTSESERVFYSIGVLSAAVELYKGFGVGARVYEFTMLGSAGYGGGSVLPVYAYKSLYASDPIYENNRIRWFLTAYTGGSFWAQETGDESLKSYYKAGLKGRGNFAFLYRENVQNYYAVTLDIGLMHIGFDDGQSGFPVYITLGFSLAGSVLDFKGHLF